MAPPRTTVIAVADVYLQGGLIGHDPSQVVLAPVCIRAENGWDTGGREAIAAQLPQMTMCRSIRNLRWLVEGVDAVARYDLLLDGAGEMAVIEYFRIGPEGIEEIVGTFPLEGPVPNALGPAEGRLRNLRSHLRSGQSRVTVEVARACFIALTSGDLGSAPFGSDISLVENGLVETVGLEETVSHLRAGRWAQVREARLLQWIVEGGEAVGRFELGLADGGLLVGSIYLRLFAGLVRELELAYGAGPSPALLEQFNGHSVQEQ